MVMMRRGKISTQHVINIQGIPDLDYIEYNGETLKIGTLVTLSEIEDSPEIRKNFPLLSDAASHVGSPQIRNAGTIGGNLCNAAPFGDMAPPLISMGAQVRIKNVNSERIIALEDFFSTPGKSVLQEGEVLLEIQVPNPPPFTRGAFLKMPARTAIDIAVVSVAAMLTFDTDGNRISDAKLVLGAVSPTPVRARQAEDFLKGKTGDKKLIEKAARIAKEECNPITDIRASEEYRREMIGGVITHVLKELTGGGLLPPEAGNDNGRI
jgi:carbon-monoxide dehydrogenase medium subunit